MKDTRVGCENDRKKQKRRKKNKATDVKATAATASASASATAVSATAATASANTQKNNKVNSLFWAFFTVFIVGTEEYHLKSKVIHSRLKTNFQ